MKKSIAFIFSLVLFVSSFSMIGSPASAASIDDPLIRQMYQDLVDEGTIDSSEIDYATWARSYLEGFEMEAVAKNSVEKIAVAAGDTTKQVVRPAYTQMKAGDIFITTDTRGKGIVGHAGIAISSTAILMMRGEGYSSEKMTYAEWKSNYSRKGTNTFIYRHSNSTAAQAAADWARRNYWHYNGGGTQIMFPRYQIHYRIGITNPSYCSLLVFQAYRRTNPSYINNPSTGFIHPYALMPIQSTTLWNVKPHLVATIYNF